MRMREPLLQGKTCLVTGASRGLGAAVARRFWNEGADLVLAVRDRAYVSALFSELDSHANQSIVTLSMDLLDGESVRTLVNRIVESGVQKLDVLVNNAAVLGPIGRVWETADKDWQNTITANLVSPALICSSVVPWMARTGGGRIINMSGSGATGPRPNFSAYAAAKAGLVRFSETLAQEVIDSNITVNCVSPGPMATEMLAAIERAGAQVAGDKEFVTACDAREAGTKTIQAAVDLIAFLASAPVDGLTGKLISPVWDNWEEIPARVADLTASDVYTLRRIIGRDRGIGELDK
jgi:3-oxoacyl-[acyl-carrier protein] reductase